MPLSTTSRRRTLGALLLALALALTLSACGGGSSTKTTNKLAATAPGSAETTRQPRPTFAKLRECLVKNGINLPKQHGFGSLLGSLQRKLPPGVSRSDFEGVMKKCGGAPLLRGGTRGFGRVRSPAFQAALKRFAACMRSAGVNVPEPNTSGKGPIFSTEGLNPKSPTFRKASAKCAGQLAGAFKGPQPATPPGA
jgi:hypothetical protein